LSARPGIRTLAAAAPAPDVCLLRTDLPLSPALGPPIFVDLTKAGRLLDGAQCAEAYPAVPLGLPGGEAAVLRVWAGLARTALAAHQRRGESDLAAHWLHQLLALDPGAAEWAHVLAHHGL